MYTNSIKRISQCPNAAYLPLRQSCREICSRAEETLCTCCEWRFTGTRETEGFICTN